MGGLATRCPQSFVRSFSHRELVHSNFSSIRKAYVFVSVVHPGSFSDCRASACVRKQVGSRLREWTAFAQEPQVPKDGQYGPSCVPMVGVGAVSCRLVYLFFFDASSRSLGGRALVVAAFTRERGRAKALVDADTAGR